jgi:hypothetical protein
MCAPGKENRGTVEGTCKKCNIARDYWPKDTELISASEFDQTCQQFTTLFTHDLHQYDYHSYIRIRGIYFVLAGTIIIAINYFLIRFCLNKEEEE